MMIPYKNLRPLKPQHNNLRQLFLCHQMWVHNYHCRVYFLVLLHRHLYIHQVLTYSEPNDSLIRKNNFQGFPAKKIVTYRITSLSASMTGIVILARVLIGTLIANKRSQNQNTTLSMRVEIQVSWTIGQNSLCVKCLTK